MSHSWLHHLLPFVSDDEVENIDPSSTRVVIANKILLRNGSSKEVMSDIHIKLKFGDDTNKNDLWKAIIYEIDKDFPWNPLNKPTTTRKFCEKCEGWLWPNTILDSNDLKKAARQVGMTRKGSNDVRIQNYVAAYRCGGNVVDKVIEG